MVLYYLIRSAVLVLLGLLVYAQTFSFDFVFDENDTQHDIYNEAAIDMVDSVLEVFNVCDMRRCMLVNILV